MPKTEEGWFGRRHAARLRMELDRVRPPDSPPRYLSARPRLAVWRLAPVALAVALTGIVALTAWAATGSANPAVWTNRVETVIRPAPPSTEEESSPSSEPSPAAPPAVSRGESPRPAQTAEPHESPEPAGSPEPRESPEPTDDHSGAGGSSSGELNPSPSPSPSPSSDSGDH